jgi:hypothetical protein
MMRCHELAGLVGSYGQTKQALTMLNWILGLG